MNCDEGVMEPSSGDLWRYALLIMVAVQLDHARHFRIYELWWTILVNPSIQSGRIVWVGFPRATGQWEFDLAPGWINGIVGLLMPRHQCVQFTHCRHSQWPLAPDVVKDKINGFLMVLKDLDDLVRGAINDAAA